MTISRLLLFPRSKGLNALLADLPNPKKILSTEMRTKKPLMELPLVFSDLFRRDFLLVYDLK